MPSLPVTAEARGAVRAFRAEVRRSAARFTGAGFEAGVPDSRLYANRGSTVGRNRALARLIRRYGPPSLVLPRAVAWAYLRPIGPVIVKPTDAGQAQPAVAVSYLTAGRLKDRATLESGVWTVEVPDHALHRLAQRARGVDLATALFEAHERILRSRFDRWPEGDLLVTAGPGAFVGQLVPGRDVASGELIIYFRPRTWLHEDQLAPGQVPIETDETIADGFLPISLRQLHRREGCLEVRRIA